MIFGDFIYSDGYIYGDALGGLAPETWMKRLIKRPNNSMFRRIYLKRRTTAGEYEGIWQEVDPALIKSFGSVSFSVDEVIPNFFKIGNLNFSVYNGLGQFSDETDDNSFWYGYLGLARTLVRVDAGYVDHETGNEYPTNSTLYIGLFGDDFTYQENNIVSFPTRHISAIFDEFPADRIPGLGTTQTASEIVFRIRDYIDSNSISVFQKYIPLADWNIISTTAYYNMATTTTLQNKSCWKLLQDLAAAEQYVTYIDKSGQFYFVPQTDVNATAFRFSGINDEDRSYGHNIIGEMQINTNTRKIYNRVNVKFKPEDTITSYYIKQDTWSWGDSSSSFIYGVKEYKYDNEFLSTAGAITVAENIYDEFKWPKKNYSFKAKFVPHLMVQDTALVTYKTQREDYSSYLWGYFKWNNAYFGYSFGYNLQVDSITARIVSLSHNIDNFTSNVTLREI
jgi:hypothetical protein